MDPCSLQNDCKNCFGFCCAALYFSASEGFPVDKEAGKPCPNLQPDFSCRLHKSLYELGFKGCIAYDCFGAGQKVAQVTYNKNDWCHDKDLAEQMFKVFLIMRQIHEMLWYLTEALTLKPACRIHSELKSMLGYTEQLTLLNPDSLIELNVAAHRVNVNALLQQTSELVRNSLRHEQKADLGQQNTHLRLEDSQLRLGNTHLMQQKTYLRWPKTVGKGLDLIGSDLRSYDLRGENFRGACLIATDLRGTDLSGVDFLGADLRDADLRGADLTGSIFLTQAQINTVKGDSDTRLPISITRPMHW